MAGTHTGVDDFQLIRCQCSIFLTDFCQLCLHFWFLLSFFQIVMPFGVLWITISGSIGRLFFLCRQKLILNIRMSFQPQTAKAVFYHVTNDPVRGEQLGCRRDIFFCDFYILFQSGENIVLFLAVVILIQPADDLHGVLPVLFGNHRNHLLDDAALAQKVIREKEFRVVRNPLKHAGKNTGQSIALNDEHVLKERIIIVCILQSIDFLHIKPIQLHGNCFGQDLRLKVILIIRENTNAGRKIAIDLHKPEGNKPVEPCIGDLLHDLLIPFFTDLSNQSLTLMFLFSRHDATKNAIRRCVPVVLIGNLI